MKALSVKLPEWDIDTADSIVLESHLPGEGRRTTRKYDSRSDFIRIAVEELIFKEGKVIDDAFQKEVG